MVLKFEWDEEKDRINREKHSVDFCAISNGEGKEALL